MEQLLEKTRAAASIPWSGRKEGYARKRPHSLCRPPLPGRMSRQAQMAGLGASSVAGGGLWGLENAFEFTQLEDLKEGLGFKRLRWSRRGVLSNSPFNPAPDLLMKGPLGKIACGTFRGVFRRALL